MAIGTPSESPAIVVKEVDLTGVVPNVQSTTGAFVGNFRWGPVEEVTLIDNEGTLASTFGAPSDSNAVDFLSAAYFLRYSQSLQVVREVTSAAKNSTDIAVGSQPTVKNNDNFDAQQSALGSEKSSLNHNQYQHYQFHCPLLKHHQPAELLTYLGIFILFAMLVVATLKRLSLCPLFCYEKMYLIYAPKQSPPSSLFR